MLFCVIYVFFFFLNFLQSPKQSNTVDNNVKLTRITLCNIPNFEC